MPQLLKLVRPTGESASDGQRSNSRQLSRSYARTPMSNWYSTAKPSANTSPISSLAMPCAKSHF